MSSNASLHFYYLAFMNHLKEFINSIAPISEQAFQVVEELAIKRTFKKGEIILEEGTICKHIYLVSSGALRVFQYDNGKEISTKFILQGNVITSYYSLISTKATQENIQALVNTELVMIPYHPLEILFDQYHELERLGRKILEDYFIKREERILILQSKTALERYQLLLADQSELLNIASLGHIASYLGITQETLSRVRNKIK